MDEEDQKDIIRKVKTSGAADDNNDVDKDLGDEPVGDEEGFGDEPVDDEPVDDEGGLEEVEIVGYNDDAGRGEEYEMLRHLSTGEDYMEIEPINPTKQRLKNFTSDDRFHKKDYNDDFDSVEDHNSYYDEYDDYSDELDKEAEMLRDLELGTGEDYREKNDIWEDSLSEGLQLSSEKGIFVKNTKMKDLIKGKLDEMTEPAISPSPVKTPTETPTKKPRRIRIFQPNPGVKTPAKMKGNDSDVK